MANIPRYNDDEINNKGMEVDFDLRKVFNMPTIKQLIFFHVNFDKCRKEIITYEKNNSRLKLTNKHMLFLSLQFSKSRERNDKVELFQKNRDGVGVGAGDGTPSGSNPREPLFLINYIIYLIQGVNSLLI